MYSALTMRLRMPIWARHLEDSREDKRRQRTHHVPAQRRLYSHNRPPSLELLHRPHATNGPNAFPSSLFPGLKSHCHPFLVESAPDITESKTQGIICTIILRRNLFLHYKMYMSDGIVYHQVPYTTT
jgi:hypothetical protein